EASLVYANPAFARVYGGSHSGHAPDAHSWRADSHGAAGAWGPRMGASRGRGAAAAAVVGGDSVCSRSHLPVCAGARIRTLALGYVGFGDCCNSVACGQRALR